MLRRTFDPNKPFRYVRYGRMSDDEQNPRSPDQQFETIEQLRKRMGYPWMHVRDYRDDAVTGRLIRKRRGFQEMLQAIRTGMLGVDLILIDTYERFGRADELAAIRGELYNTYGVLILTADSNFADPTSVAGRALSFVEQIRSTEDGRVKAHNVLRGKRDLIRQKKAWPGGPPPFGYKLQSVMTRGKNGEQEVAYKILVRDPETDWLAERIFQKAKETGWGTSRLSKFFNADPTIPDKRKPFSPATIGYVLDNPIYYGELLWEEHSTGIVNDTRVIERNAEEDMLRVPDFCEPIVARGLWDEVQGLRQKRREQLIRSRGSRQADGKQITPLAPGLTLKYLLTGLVRCGHCGASMRPSPTKSTFKSGKVWRRLYYACPSHVGGSCPNGLYVPEAWLREAVLARLRSRLFPPPDRVGQVPDWFGPLVEEVREELRRRAKEQPDQRPAWEQELKESRESVSGWSISLANPRLDPLLRADVEAQYGQTKARIVKLESLLAEQNAKQGHLDQILDPERVLDRLHRLADVLGGANPTRGNLELSLHLDRIDCFADGKVLMRTSRLGVFEGAVELLRRPEGQAGGQQDKGQQVLGQIQLRRRARHRIEEDLSKGKVHPPEMERATNPHRFAGLEDRWFWQDGLEAPQVSGWAEKNAAEVAGLRATGMTVEKLATHFGKTPPTIRKALKLAAAADPSLQKLPRKMPRGRWAVDHAAEVLKLKQEGMSTLAIAKCLGKSDTTIRAALRNAQEISPAATSPLPFDGGNVALGVDRGAGEAARPSDSTES
jgi:DNA invertase Pin-like site-specific DNA recombinase